MTDRTGQIGKDTILAVLCVRNEMRRLPFFLTHMRALGVGHFLVVDNGSDDGTAEMLAGEGDVSLWRTGASYRAARFGLDWMTWLQIRYAHGHWCLMADADELLVYDGCERHDLRDLTALLEARGQAGFGTLMLDLYPKGPLGPQDVAEEAPLETLCWFDPVGYRARRQAPRGNLWVQGGARERVFFAEHPVRSPTLNKLPLVKWSRRYAYTNSCHAALPPRLNRLYDGPGEMRPCGVLLHTKFLPDAPRRAAEEKGRGQHFHDPGAFEEYYDALSAGPDLWWDGAARYTGPGDLVARGLMAPIDW